MSNISSETTFTASYSNVSATCTVVYSQYIFYDKADANNLSQYTTICRLGSNSGSLVMNPSYSNQAYTWLASGGDGWVGYALPNGRGSDNVRFSLEMYKDSTSAYVQIIIGVTDILVQTTESTAKEDMVMVRGDNKTQVMHNNNWEIWTTSNAITSNAWYKMVFEKSGTSFNYELYDMNGTLKKSYSWTGNSYDNPYFVIMTNGNNSGTRQIREIKLESL